MKKVSFLIRLCLSAMLLAPIGASAQVTVGSGNLPSPFSLLDLDTSIYPKALHLPRLDEETRDLLITSGDESIARGLMIFNIDTKCVEFWNETEWISLCDAALP